MDEGSGWFSLAGVNAVVFLRCFNRHCWFGDRKGIRLLNERSAVTGMGDGLATIDMGRKVGAAMSLSVGAVGSPPNTMSPGPRPTSIPSGILIHATVWPQYTNVTDRDTDRTTVP